MKISLIIPTLHENESVGLLFDKLKQIFCRKDVELIFVDDGSNDGTREKIKNFVNDGGVSVKLVEGRRRGLAQAVLLGFNEGGGDVLGAIDADLSHPPEILPIMIEYLNNVDIVIASRNILGGGVEVWPWDRKLFSSLATLLAKPLARGVSDPMSGFFLMKRSVLRGVQLNPCGYKILLEILTKGKYQKIKDVPYIFRNRDLGKSKMNFRIMLAYLVHLCKLYLWVCRRMSFLPIFQKLGCKMKKNFSAYLSR
jgi:dolichol-phosphate mannosyltransferase